MRLRTQVGAGLDRWIEDHREEMVAFRRHLHANPELSWEEHATTEFIGERLEVADLRPRRLDVGTGLVCDIGPNDGPLVAIRADIDALAMDDLKDVHYRSRNAGVAHACGHDVHTTIAMGAGLYLAHLPDGLPGGVRLVFQPAEEQVPGGAVAVIDDGGLDGVDAIYGVHCDPKLDVGKVGLRTGAITSAADILEIKLEGPGGHTARPEETVDLVKLAGRVITELPAEVDKQFDGDGLLKLVFGSVHSGDAPNVIPTSAVVRASIRTPSDEVWDAMAELVPKAVDNLLADTGATYEIELTAGVPPVINHHEPIEVARQAAAAVLGPDAITEAIQSWGGDDFSWYLREIPGAYIRLGVHDPASTAPRLDLHAGHFDVDERAIDHGIRMLVATALFHLAALDGA